MLNLIFPNFCIFYNLLNWKVLEVGEEKDGLYMLKYKGQTENNDQHFRGLQQIKDLIATRNKVDVLLCHKRMVHASAGACNRFLVLAMIIVSKKSIVVKFSHLLNKLGCLFLVVIPYLLLFLIYY